MNSLDYLEQAMLAAPSSPTHIYTLPLDIVISWLPSGGKREMGHLDAVPCGILKWISENTASTPALTAVL